MHGCFFRKAMTGAPYARLVQDVVVSLAQILITYVAKDPWTVVVRSALGATGLAALDGGAPFGAPVSDTAAIAVVALDAGVPVADDPTGVECAPADGLPPAVLESACAPLPELVQAVIAVSDVSAASRRAATRFRDGFTASA